MLYSQQILFPNKILKHDFDFLDSLLVQDCFSIVKNTAYLKILENPRLKKWMQFKNFVIFGTGGSSLGGQCIHAISNKLDKSIRFINNLDPSGLNELFSAININETGFLCISKSGETLETICQILLSIDRIKISEKIEDKFIFITENKKSSLKEIADEFNFLCLNHPSSIGGRFSVFSIVGMLPALLCGVDPYRIISGGRRVLDNFENSIHKINEGVCFVIENFLKKITQHVSFIYSDRLIPFGSWLSQLYAESTGKTGKGITPITAIGSIDQHSQLQLYLDGTCDKCFTFFLENQEDTLKIPDKFLPQNFSYLKNKKIYDIFKAQHDATIMSILEKKCSVRKIEIPSLTPESLGALFMHFMLEISCICKLIEVDPFNQPAVERGKIITKDLLSQSA